MTVLDETPELPLFSWGGAGAAVALGVSVAETTISLVMVTTTPFCCVLSILVWLVDGRTTRDTEGEVGVALVAVDLGG
jgi:hypothetical protein